MNCIRQAPVAALRGRDFNWTSSTPCVKYFKLPITLARTKHLKNQTCSS